jgi:GT2 family glycosyltransferase
VARKTADYLTMPKVSVVIPTFNRKDALKQTIQSFKDQTFTDFEIVVADDGSNDGTNQMVNTLDLPFPVKHVWHENAGRSAARNLGVKAAEGEIIIFNDDHVIVDKNYVTEHLEYHQKYSPGAVRGQMYFINDPKNAPTTPPSLSFMTKLKKRLEENNPLRFHTGNVSVSKEAFQKIKGFDEDFKEYGFQDQEFGYRLRKAGYRIKFNPNAVGYIFKTVFNFEKMKDKARQAGHSAVLCRKKHGRFGMHCGANSINLLIYRILASDNWYLRRMEIKLSRAKNPSQIKKYREKIKFFYFLLGIHESSV